MLKMQSIIEEYTGVRTTLVRFPGGSSNTISNFNPGIMTRLTKTLNEMGFQYFDWNVNSGDAGLTKKKDRVVEYVIEGVREYQVSVVLQHDIKKYSVEAVEEIILWALENGYEFLPLEPNSPNAHHRVRN
jgi:peptidoglycan/xylan/chitin deacetylase (PgdA/CDA1 family)